MEDRPYFYKGFPVQTGQSSEKAITLEGALEIQHSTTGLTGSRGYYPLFHNRSIEGACRHLARDRMDITGARWRLNYAETVLRLRALRANDNFDAYWQFHKLQELKSNHLARFQEPEQFLNG